MGDKKQISAKGERAAIGGYLPQFDIFASLAYNELINQNLEWIKVADPEAEKLDDIQYSTPTEIHAYQVKWTISGDKISFSDFKKLLPKLTSSWKKIKNLPSSANKKVIPHLLTNKLLSSNDSIKNASAKIGTFKDFFKDVWLKLKVNQEKDIDKKWLPIIKELIKLSELDEAEFKEFISVFDFTPKYDFDTLEIEYARVFQKDSDLIDFRSFIMEKIASPKREVQFTSHEIINRLGWQKRVEPTFNHNLIIDRQKYQPIQSTIDSLNSKIDKHNNGYLFLVGGPGTGKSTLLTQWSKSREERIFKYYAFDFTNVSIREEERGESVNMLFDLMLQMQKHRFFTESVLLYRDIVFLREQFYKQLKALGDDFLKTGKASVIIIDGLDHVPREYKTTTKSFLRDLPLPNSLPQGVYVVLGSQSYGLDDIPAEIKAEYQKSNRTIQIGTLNKQEVGKYLDAVYTSSILSNDQRQKIFEKSQGHPLYLSYIIGKIQESDNVDKALENFEPIDGEIDNYYNKIWTPIQEDENLIELLGLISRINGTVKPGFVREWEFNIKTLKSFKEKVKFLFNVNSSGDWSFFHNSFKIFLLSNTAIDYLTGDYDRKINISYHKRLAEFYSTSEVEDSWNGNYHLFESNQYDKFITQATPDSFNTQLVEFRPPEDIEQDIFRGITIAKYRQDVDVLLMYLFALAELDSKWNNVYPVGLLIEPLLSLGKSSIAKNYIRLNNKLRCRSYEALEAASLFVDFGDKTEAAILFNLGYPIIVTDIAIVIDESQQYRDVEEILKKWIYVAPHFMKIDDIILKINNIRFKVPKLHHFRHENKDKLRLDLLFELCSSLINSNKWTDLDIVIKTLNPQKKNEQNLFIGIIEYAIIETLKSCNNHKANEYLKTLLEHFQKESTSSNDAIRIADLIYKVKGYVDLNWIEDINQPLEIDNDNIDYSKGLHVFAPMIKLNRLLNIAGKGVPTTEAVPSATIRERDEVILVEFKRMLCLIAQIQSEGILQTPLYGDISRKIEPIIRIYYRKVSFASRYDYSIHEKKGDYYGFLIDAVATTDRKNLEKVGDFLLQEFINKPQYWSAPLQRKVIHSLIKYNYDNSKLEQQLKNLELFMLEGNGDIDGRIQECIAHAEVWTRLNKPDIAEKWLKRAIQESLGVGYSKDYQFDTWLEWLGRINKIQPSQALNRIQWFSSHLKHIKETTDGSAYVGASNNLLDVAFYSNFAYGFEQSKWQLDKGLASFEDTMEIFIENYIKRVSNETEFKPIIQLYCELFLFAYQSRGIGDFLLKLIIEKGYSLMEDSFFASYLPYLIHSIDTKPLEQHRFSLLSTIKEFCESKNKDVKNYCSDFKISTQKQENQASKNYRYLKFKNGKQISEEDVISKSEDIEILKGLMREEGDNSFFDWKKAISKAAHLLTLEDIKEINIISKSKKARFYAKLSECALKLEDKDLALALANKSLEMSDALGWVKMYDGGSRVEAFNALKKVDADKCYEKAFEVFTNDILNKYGRGVTEYLDEILPLLPPNYNVESVWNRVFEYVKSLMSNSKPIKDLPSIDSQDRRISEVLTDYLIELCNALPTMIRKRAKVLLSLNINQGNTYALNRLMDFDQKSPSNLEIMGDVIAYLLHLKSDKLNELTHVIRQLAISRDYNIRNIARQTLLYLDEDIPKPKEVDVPSIYSLHLGDFQRPKFDKEINENFPEIDTKNPEDLVKPYGMYINILSKKCGIDRDNLIHRFHSIMKEISASDAWSVDYEKELVAHLSEINLEYPYRRPRAVEAQKGIMYLATELIDSGILNNSLIENIFIPHDSAVPFFREIPKPLFVPSLQREGFRSLGQEWLDDIDNDNRLDEKIILYKENKNIIGEYSLIKSLEWGIPTEIYMSQLAIRDEMSEDYYIYGSVFHRLTKDYYSINQVGTHIIVIRDQRFFNQFNNKSNWLAFNPALAKHFGWSPNEDKLFGWNDENGELMIESIYWRNGNPDIRPYKESDAGEGWFVVASDKALEQIKSLTEQLYIHKSLQRTKSEDTGLNKKSTRKIVRFT